MSSHEPPFWFQFALMARRVEATLKREGEADRVALAFAEDNRRLREQIHSDARKRGLPLKVGPWDPDTGRSDMSLAAWREPTE